MYKVALYVAGYVIANKIHCISLHECIIYYTDLWVGIYFLSNSENVCASHHVLYAIDWVARVVFF